MLMTLRQDLPSVNPFFMLMTLSYSRMEKSSLAIEKSLQEDLNSLQAWCIENGLYINSKKTQYMTFGSRSKLKEIPKLSLNIEGVPLEKTLNYTYLGVTLDEQLNFEQHARNLIKRVSDKTYQLRRLRRFLNTKAALSVYKNMILTILEYGDIFISSTTLNTRKKRKNSRTRD